MFMSNQIYFLNDSHKEQFNMLLDDTCYPHDRERKAMFYIIAGCDDLFVHNRTIYDFEKEELAIAPNLGHLKKLCTSAKVLLMLAIQFYNSVNNKQSVYDTFIYLDSDNKRLALEAIKIRFNF